MPAANASAFVLCSCLRLLLLGFLASRLILPLPAFGQSFRDLRVKPDGTFAGGPIDLDPGQLTIGGVAVGTGGVTDYSNLTGVPAALTSLASTLASRGHADEVYLAVRTDNVVGTGTEADPYDASSAAKFDALLAGFFTSHASKPLVIHLGRGVFSTSQRNIYGHGFFLRQGWVLAGAGMYATEVRNTNTSAEGLTMFSSHGTSWGSGFTEDNVTIRDLTLNGQKDLYDVTPGTGWWAAIRLNGGRNRVERVRAIGFGSNSIECWPLWVGSSGEDNVVTDSIVEDCSGSMSAIRADGSGSVARKNFVDFTGTSGTGLGISAETVDDNRIIGGTHGVYIDSLAPTRGITVTKNRIEGTTAACIQLMPNDHSQKYLVSGNICFGTGNGDGIVIDPLATWDAVQEQWENGSGQKIWIDQVTVTDNNIGTATIFMSQARAVILSGNTVASATFHRMTAPDALQNLTTAGAVPPGLENSVPGLGGTLADGDFGDITVSSSGTVMTIDSSAVSFNELAGSATTAQLPAAATLDTEWDTAAKINAATTDADFSLTTHTHTGTSLSGIDISDDTNLAGTANEITLTGDTLSIHADIARDSEVTTAVAAKVSLTGAETIAGVKTFSSAPVLSAATVSRPAVINASGQLTSGTPDEDYTTLTNGTPDGDDTCVAPAIKYDASYIYVCDPVALTWDRVAVADVP